MKHFRTIAVTMIAMAVVVVAMASAPAASAGEIVEPEQVFTYPDGTWAFSYGLTDDGTPYTDISLTGYKASGDIRDIVNSALNIWCNARAQSEGIQAYSCYEGAMDAVNQKLYWGQPSALPAIRVTSDTSDPTGYFVQELQDLGA